MKAKNLFIFILLFLTISCIDEIEFTPDSDNRVIIVDGILTDQDTIQTIKINTSSTVGSQVFQAYRNADVKIIEDQSKVYDLQEIEFGEYSFQGKAEEGKSYVLEIYKNNKLIASSTAESTPPPFPIDSVSFEEKLLSYTNVDGKTRNLWSVEFYAHCSKDLADQDYFLRFGELETVFLFPEIDTKVFPPPMNCYIYNYNNNVEVQSYFVEEGAQDVRIKSKILSKQTTYDFAHGFSAKTTLFSMTKESYEYWNQLSILFNQSGNITDQLPAQFSGNVKQTDEEPIIGNFSVVRTSSAHTLVTRSDLFRPPLKYCGNIGGPYPSPVPNYCFSCLSHPNAVAEIPFYW